MLTSRINGTETQKMGLLISFPLGELAAKKYIYIFFNALNPGKDNCSRYIDFQ